MSNSHRFLPKTALRALAAAVLAVSLVALPACSTGQAQGSAASEPEAALKVEVVIDSTSVDSPVSYDEEIGLEEGATVLDALNALAEQEDISVNITDSAYGSYVSGIGGLAERDHGDMSGWMYEVNGESPSDSAGDHVLADGDVVTWTYVTEF